MDTNTRGQYKVVNVDYSVLIEEDANLKHRIRQLKFMSRIAAVGLSVASLVPVALTLAKFEETKSILRTVQQPDGTVITRNLWAINTRVWPTIMYTAVGAISVILNSLVLLSYRKGVDRANQAAKVASGFTWAVLMANFIVWVVAATLYRKEKDPINGTATDLWGWTCSPAAQKIQKEFEDQISFNQYCTVQTVSWYFGIAQTASSLLSIITYALALLRLRKKQQMKKYAAYAES